MKAYEIVNTCDKTIYVNGEEILPGEKTIAFGEAKSILVGSEKGATFSFTELSQKPNLTLATENKNDSSKNI